MCMGMRLCVYMYMYTCICMLYIYVYIVEDRNPPHKHVFNCRSSALLYYGASKNNNLLTVDGEIRESFGYKFAPVYLKINQL